MGGGVPRGDPNGERLSMGAGERDNRLLPVALLGLLLLRYVLLVGEREEVLSCASSCVRDAICWFFFCIYVHTKEE